VALKGVKQRDNVRTIDMLALAFFIPISKLVTYPNEGWRLRARGMGISVTDFVLVNDIVKVDSDSHK
jgi:hypothetical protein